MEEQIEYRWNENYPTNIKKNINIKKRKGKSSDRQTYINYRDIYRSNLTVMKYAKKKLEEIKKSKVYFLDPSKSVSGNQRKYLNIKNKSTKKNLKYSNGELNNFHDYFYSKNLNKNSFVKIKSDALINENINNKQMVNIEDHNDQEKITYLNTKACYPTEQYFKNYRDELEALNQINQKTIEVNSCRIDNNNNINDPTTMKIMDYNNDYNNCYSNFMEGTNDLETLGSRKNEDNELNNHSQYNTLNKSINNSKRNNLSNSKNEQNYIQSYCKNYNKTDQQKKGKLKSNSFINKLKSSRNKNKLNHNYYNTNNIVILPSNSNENFQGIYGGFYKKNYLTESNRNIIPSNLYTQKPMTSKISKQSSCSKMFTNEINSLKIENNDLKKRILGYEYKVKVLENCLKKLGIEFEENKEDKKDVRKNNLNESNDTIKTLTINDENIK